MNKIKCSVESLLGTTTEGGGGTQGGGGTRCRPPAAAKNVTCLLSNLIALFSLFAFAAEFFWRIFQ